MKKIGFDLTLSNKIYKQNLNSLLKVSLEIMTEVKRQDEEFLKKLVNKDSIDDWFETSSHLANIDWIILNSVFISSFAFFEHHIFSLARIVEDKTPSSITINDLNGNGIIKYYKYLSLVGNLKNANRTNRDWQEIDYFQKVRNIITHNGGIMVSDLSEKLEKHECFNFLKEHNVTMAGNTGLIRIKQTDFIEDFKDHTFKISDGLTAEIAEIFKI